MGAKRDEVGKTRRALAKALGEAGYDVDPQHIRQMYSTRSYRPLALWRWEVAARRRLDGRVVMIRSWDTMGACVRHGIDDPAASVVVQARGGMPRRRLKAGP